MGTDFGGSLPVENVQALASTDLEEKDIATRYIRPELDSEQVLLDDPLQIPVIDMHKLVVLDDLSVHQNELQKLHLACKEWGFFQLVNHGIPSEVTEKMKIDMAEFFKLPLQEKMAYAQQPNNIEGYGQAFVLSEEQKLDWGDMFFLLAQPVSIRNTRLWPNIPASFRDTLDKYSTELQKVTIHLLKLMAKNLGLDSDEVSSLFEGGTQGVRMNYYPPCVLADKVMGLTTHSDAAGLTLLIQVNEVEGLQIKKDGTWVPIKPVPGAFIINIGDIIEIMTNGEYKSIEHRAVVNPKRERLSIAAFHGPNMKTIVGPLPELVKDKAIYKSLTHEEFIKLAVTSKLDGKNLLSRMKLER